MDKIPDPVHLFLDQGMGEDIKFHDPEESVRMRTRGNICHNTRKREEGR